MPGVITRGRGTYGTPEAGRRRTCQPRSLEAPGRTCQLWVMEAPGRTCQLSTVQKIPCGCTAYSFPGEGEAEAEAEAEGSGEGEAEAEVPAGPLLPGAESGSKRTLTLAKARLKAHRKKEAAAVECLSSGRCASAVSATSATTTTVQPRSSARTKTRGEAALLIQMAQTSPTTKPARSGCRSETCVESASVGPGGSMVETTPANFSRMQGVNADPCDKRTRLLETRSTAHGAMLNTGDSSQTPCPSPHTSLHPSPPSLCPRPTLLPSPSPLGVCVRGSHTRVYRAAGPAGAPLHTCSSFRVLVRHARGRGASVGAR